LYWNRPGKTAETMQEDWINTGDRFSRDGDGYYFFKGRADDLIKVSGQWVHPLEVERCLQTHLGIAECAVLAHRLEDQRMTLRAVVVLKDGAPANIESMTRELQDFVKHTLLPYKYPRIIEYRGELPKTATGKIDRQALKSRVPDGPATLT
jgi:acyl-coenzyme A synthetase/AMP-(fatty) acid ligase